MLEASTRAVMERLNDDDVVLDVGGWAKPFARADWVLDLLPYESRGLYGYEQGDKNDERFTEQTWIVRDMCDREPWPFDDRQFDFSICSHTLEDVRDPIWVCHELMRVSKAGYIEVPSRMEEQTPRIQGPHAGWGHHHWFVDVLDGGIDFVFKHHIIHSKPELQVPPKVTKALPPHQRVQSFWWQDSFDVRERIFIGDPTELDEYLRAVVPAEKPRRWNTGRR